MTKSSFYRTIEELKWIYRLLTGECFICFYRTIEELKFKTVIAYGYESDSFYRTIEELKFEYRNNKLSARFEFLSHHRGIEIRLARNSAYHAAVFIAP